MRVTLGLFPLGIGFLLATGAVEAQTSPRAEGPMGAAGLGAAVFIDGGEIFVGRPGEFPFFPIPPNPVFAGCFSETGTGNNGTGFSHDAQCLAYNGPDTDHNGKEICFGANETAISISDVSDKANPVSIATAVYPNPAYVHQGWISDDHHFFFVNDEGDEVGGLVERTRKRSGFSTVCPWVKTLRGSPVPGATTRSSRVD